MSEAVVVIVGWGGVMLAYAWDLDVGVALTVGFVAGVLWQLWQHNNAREA